MTQQDKSPQQPSRRPPIQGTYDIEADTDLGNGEIAAEFGRYSGRKVRQIIKRAQAKKQVLSTDLESDQTRTDINVGTEE